MKVDFVAPTQPIICHGEDSVVVKIKNRWICARCGHEVTAVVDSA